MLESRWSPPRGATARVGLVSTYPPTRCGIGRFAASLVEALEDADPDLEVDVVRLVNGRERDETVRREVAMAIDPESAVAVRSAAKHLSKCDVTVLNHEYGIFGGGDGESVLDLADQIDSPILAVLHTVLPGPTESQKSIVQRLARRATLVVLCEAARGFLANSYEVPERDVLVIPHGAHWDVQPINQPPRRELITWGLLGPGKGLERSIASVARLKDFDPSIRYRIVGRTHPMVAKRQGFAYRDSLRQLIEDLGVRDHVEFVGRYVDDRELCRLVRESDVVVVPYDNEDQVSSGVITEAIGMGRPVVATRFPYSQEMLSDGSGIVVDHDVDSLAVGVRELLGNPVTYRQAARAASLRSAVLSWDSVSLRYARVIRSLAPVRATA